MIRLHTLGSLDLRGSDGQELRAVLAQPKRAALLVYLALATPRRPHRRDSLLALFWPEQDTEHARNALNQAVYFIRGQLGSNTLLSNGDGLHLEWKDFWCDAAAFEEALDRGRPADAVALYRGDLLDGFHVADAPDFTEWLEAERARLAARYLTALETVAEEREADRDYGGAIREWRQLAARAPYSSRVSLRLMRALVAAGDRAGAVQHARVHETLLREELDIVPDAEVTAFVKQLQSAPAQSLNRASNEPGLPPSELTSGPAAEVEPKSSPGRPIASNRRQRPRGAALVGASLLAIFAVGGGALAVKKEAGIAANPLIRSLAVLPLENLSGDSTQQPFTDGLHDVLITELARYPELSVISRTSVLQYKGTKKRLSEIARELKVDGLVEGALVRDGGRVRITAQLVHGPSDRHVWAKRYERDLRDVLLLQSDLAEAIAREVNIAAKPLAPTRRKAAGPADSTPQELYLRELFLRGRHAEVSLSWNGVQAAKAYYQRAVELDSTFAPGYAGLATIYGVLADYAFARVQPALDTASMMARRAAALDSSLPESRAELAVTLADAGQFKAAEREFRRAIKLGPSNARAHYSYSILLVALGRGDEALREAKRAAELDPFGPRGQLAMQRYATWLRTGERPYLKLPVAQRRPILKVEPSEPWARSRDALEFAQEGKCGEARVAIRQAQQLVQPDNARMLAVVGSVYWWCGERRRARQVLADMKRRADAHDYGYRIARLHTVFGEKDSAFIWLDRNRWTMSALSGLSADPLTDPLRSDPRFSQLLRRLGVRD
jgi:TolB-like protein/DNA-binding SARP family transcriptional activator/Flp pilus assembly protein TadD